MPFLRSMTDPKTGALLSSAYGVVTDWNLQGAADIGMVTLNWYATKEVYAAGYAPVQTDPITLSAAEQTAGAGQLLGVLEALLHARPAYAGASTTA